MKQGKRMLTMVTLAVLVAFWLSGPANAESLQFYQLDVILEDSVTLNSDWGVVYLTFVGSTDILYFNLTINGSWQVQSMPVLSIEGSGVTQTQRFWFDLGNEVGADVDYLYYSYRLTTDAFGPAPADSIFVSVGDDTVVVYNSGGDSSFERSPPPAEPQVGGRVTDPNQHKHEGFPNQENTKRYQCVPATVSNSLQFLNAKHNMGLNVNDLTIDKMETACGFTGGWGCDPDNWWATKKAYMEDPAHNLPITTKAVGPDYIDKIGAEIDAGQDVELVGSGHCSAVVGIARTEEGKHVITVAHDTKPDDPTGGTVKESGTWDGFEMTGALAVHHQKLKGFVIECPKKDLIVSATPPKAPVETPATITMKNNGDEPITVTEIRVHRPSCSNDVIKVDIVLEPGQIESIEYPGNWGRPTSVEGQYKVNVSWTKYVTETTFERYGAAPIPTLTEWGLIIFGAVLIGFITWAFLKRRKVVGVRA